MNNPETDLSISEAYSNLRRTSAARGCVQFLRKSKNCMEEIGDRGAHGKQGNRAIAQDCFFTVSFSMKHA